MTRSQFPARMSSISMHSTHHKLASSSSLLIFRNLLCLHRQVRFFVLVISPGVLVDTCDLFRGERAFDPGRQSQHKTERRDHCALSYQGARSHNRVLTDNNVIEESSPHTDQ